MRGLLLRFSKNYYSKVQKDITFGGEVCHLHYFSDAKLTSETCKELSNPSLQTLFNKHLDTSLRLHLNPYGGLK